MIEMIIKPEDYYNVKKEIDKLNPDELSIYIIDLKSRANSTLNSLKLGVSLMKKNMIDEAICYLNDIYLDDNVVYTGYYKGWDGNWHAYDDGRDDQGHKNSNNGNSGDWWDCCLYTACCCGCCCCYNFLSSRCFESIIDGICGMCKNCVC